MMNFTPRILNLVVAAILSVGLIACGEGGGDVGAPPPPQALGDSDAAYFSGMTVRGHLGPKGQIHLAGKDGAIWFTSVRDTVAFTRLPEETRDIRAIYVSDMSRADTWDDPGDAAWAKAEGLVYVIGSSKRGGMGTPELVPFSDRADADAFTAEFGGTVITWADIKDDDVLGEVDLSMDMDDMGQEGGKHGN